MEVSAEPEFWTAEAKWAQSLADSGSVPQIAGIVAHVPLELGVQAGVLLDDLIAEVPLFRGVRQAEAQNFLLNASYVEGVRQLAARNLSLDLLVNTTTQIMEASALAQQVPQARFVIDHMGIGPYLSSDPAFFASWAKAIIAISQVPNVYVKLSLNSYDPWTYDQVQPYIFHVLKSFGFRRALYGGCPRSSRRTSRSIGS
eukprot:TRINITY_DN759_c0_g1_i2.p1 TRINITY_DN759_c0_g1~~TRINITY_DN759_c0_g1_i2.p1  ORF type:complete len:200 (-),score=25.87 TRINITY_DN759_c0_g1_i2:228-827(-)